MRVNPIALQLAPGSTRHRVGIFLEAPACLRTVGAIACRPCRAAHGSPRGQAGRVPRWTDVGLRRSNQEAGRRRRQGGRGSKKTSNPKPSSLTGGRKGFVNSLSSSYEVRAVNEAGSPSPFRRGPGIPGGTAGVPGHMLGAFRCARYGFVLGVHVSGAFAGATLRGGFGHVFKRTVCLWPPGDCGRCLCAPSVLTPTSSRQLRRRVLRNCATWIRYRART